MKSNTQQNVHFLKAETPHQKNPGVQILRAEEIKELVEQAKKKEACMPIEGEWIKQQFYNFTVTDKEKEVVIKEQTIIKQEKEVNKKVRPVSALLPGGVRNQINTKIKRQQKAEMAKGRKLPKVIRKKNKEKLLEEIEEICKSEGSLVYEEYLNELQEQKQKPEEDKKQEEEEFEFEQEAESEGAISEEENKIEEDEMNVKQIERDDSQEENKEEEEEQEEEKSTQMQKGVQSNQHSQVYTSSTANLLNDFLNEVSFN